MSDELDELELEHDGAGTDDDGEAVYTCDVEGCGRTFESASSLGMHRWAKHKIRGAGRRSSSSSSSTRNGGEASPRRNAAGGAPLSSTKRGRLVAETARELADLMDSARGRLAADGLTIAETIRRDADRMGDALAGLAERNLFGLGAIIGGLIDNLFGAGGPLSLLTAFGPTVRKTLEQRPRRERVDNELAGMQAEFERIYEQDGPEVANAWAQEHGLVVSGSGDGE